jgi:hypothetical protein
MSSDLWSYVTICLAWLYEFTPQFFLLCPGRDRYCLSGKG